MTQNALLTNRLAQNTSFGGKHPVVLQGRRDTDEFPDNVFRIANYITHTVIPENPDGFTIDPVTLRMPVFPRLIFLVSSKDCERKFYKKPRMKEVADWIWQHRDILSRPGHYIGGWWDKGIFFLDVTLPIRGMRAAFNAAYANRQIAIYHPFSGQSFYLPKAA